MEDKNDKAKPVSLNVFEERAQVDKKIVEKGKVRIIKKVSTEDEKVSVPLKSEEVRVERVPVNAYVDSPPPVRYEGNTTIISVVKEVAVIEKKILLVEEIHINKQVDTIEEESTIPLRKEDVIVETSRAK
jgi:uncharacterized protein (TIGR02271 family)